MHNSFLTCRSCLSNVEPRPDPKPQQQTLFPNLQATSTRAHTRCHNVPQSLAKSSSPCSNNGPSSDHADQLIRRQSSQHCTPRPGAPSVLSCRTLNLCIPGSCDALARPGTTCRQPSRSLSRPFPLGRIALPLAQSHSSTRSR